MDTKKLILAVVLSIIVISAYQYFFVKPVPMRTAQPSTNTAPGSTTPGKTGDEKKSTLDLGSILNDDVKTEEKSEIPAPTVEASITDAQEKTVSIETPDFTAVFTNKGAGLKSFVLKKYKDDQKNQLDLVSEKAEKTGTTAIYPFYFSPFGKESLFKILNGEKYLYQGETSIRIGNGEQKEISFEYASQEKNISAKKTFIFTAGSFVVQMKFEVSQNGKKIEEVPVIFGPDLENNISLERTMLMKLKIGAYNGDGIKPLEFAKVKSQPTQDPNIEAARGEMGTGFYWAAYETTYFAAILKTDMRSQLAWVLIKRKLDNNKADLLSYMTVTNPKAVYLGPKDEEMLAKIESSFPDANKVIEYGWFGSIAKIMLKGILFIHRVIPNYGWAIIFFTLFLKIVLFPLTYSSSVSMAKMQTLQPKMKAIRKKYKNSRDPEQRRLMNMETMALYKQEKVNPASGCLPMLLQLPILWGFFRLLQVSITVRHEPWMLWITDLSKKDPIYLLPILMGVTQLIVQKMTPSGGDETQKKLMYIMPVLMIVLFASFPSGLNLYWFFSNVLQIGQQKIINDKMFSKKKEEEKEKKSLKRKKGAIEK